MSMPLTQIGIIVACLVAGYWIVSKIIDSARDRTEIKGDPDQRSNTGEPPVWEDARSRSSGREPRWHEVLDVPPTADSDEIRRAYKSQIGQYHPDKVASLGPDLRALAELKSTQINKAYSDALRQRGLDV
ncbi:MAG: J domain-containing protein [Dokdonella sp.]